MDTRRREERTSGHKHRKRRLRSRSPDQEFDSDSSSNSSGSDTEDSGRNDKRKRRKSSRDSKHRGEADEPSRRRGKSEERSKKTKGDKKKSKEDKRKRKKEKAGHLAKRPITSSWGKYGLLKEIDMWNKRPEFSAWLGEVKKVNMETLSTWEEKQMFKEYMEDYNTATFPSKKYYDLDIYHRRKLFRARAKGLKAESFERIEFNDEEQRRLELRREREQQKEVEVDALKRSILASGQAQAMRDQAHLREEMQYQFRLGNLEAAAAIQRKLGPDLLPSSK